MHIHETGDYYTLIEERHAARQAELAATLAEELDVDTSTAATALERAQARLIEQHRVEHRAALQERLDAVVEAGELTREQADAILAAVEADVLGGFWRRGHHGPPVGLWAFPPGRGLD